MEKLFLYGVLQNFNIQRIHSDNGPVFRNSRWLQILNALKIKVVESSAQNPASRGKIEKSVGIVKDLLKKILATSRDLNWDLLPFIISKVLNQSVVTKTGYKPAELVFGKQPLSESFIKNSENVPIHHQILPQKIKIDKLSKEIKMAYEDAKSRWENQQNELIEKTNINKIHKEFSENDIVFALDRYTIPGNSRPLKTKFHPSPWMVVKPYHTTTLIKRLADGFTTLYSNNHIKKLKGGSPFFKTLPKAVQSVILHGFDNLLDSELENLIKIDPLTLPEGEKLYDTIENPFLSQRLQGEGLGTPPEKVSSSPVPVAQESEKTVSPTQVPVAQEEKQDSDSENSGDEGEESGVTLRSGKRVHFS
jgi:hypothetical protein